MQHLSGVLEVPSASSYISLADKLDALKARASAGDADALAEYVDLHGRAHNPTGPQDKPVQAAWSLHVERDRSRREDQSRRFLARVQADVVRTAIHELRRPLIVTAGSKTPRTRSRGAGRPAARRSGSRSRSPASDAGELGAEPDLPPPALRRGVIPRARAPPGCVRPANLTVRWGRHTPTLSRPPATDFTKRGA